MLKMFGNAEDPSFSNNGEALRNMELLQEGITQLQTNFLQTKTALEKCRKEHSEALMAEKEKIISLEYQLKLS
jgi:hypothetical protein